MMTFSLESFTHRRAPSRAATGRSTAVCLLAKPLPTAARRWPQAAGLVCQTLVVGALALAGATGAQAQEHRPMPGHDSPGSMMMPRFDGPAGDVIGRLDRFLDGLGLSDAQRGQIRQIATAAAADLKAQRDAGRLLHQRAAELFTAPTVDAAAAENLRQDMLTQQDQASKRVMRALLDIAQVLTPAQRAKLGERLRDRKAVMQDRAQRMQHPPHGGPGPGPRPAP